MWQTGSATDYLDLLTQLVQIATRSGATSLDTVVSGGSGYAQGDILTVSGGTGAHATKIRVLTVSAGAVVTARIQEGGAYTSAPADPVSVTGGGGTGATFNLTYANNGWTALRDTTWSGGSGSEKEVILEGVGSGSDDITVGVRTFRRTVGLDTAYSWALHGMTGYNGALSYAQQPGLSPIPDPNAATGGALVPLHNGGTGTPLNFWFGVSARRICGVVQLKNAGIGVNHYASLYLGFLNPFNSATEWPYPIYIGGCSSARDALYKDTTITFSGLTEAINTGSVLGPGFIRRTDGAWVSVANSINILGSGRNPYSDGAGVYPGKLFTASPTLGDTISGTGNFNWQSIILNSGDPGAATLNMRPTPHSGGDRRIIVPATVAISEASTAFRDMVGEMEGVFWVPGQGVVSEDAITEGNDRYRVFQNGNRTQLYSYMCIKEE